MSTGTYVTSDGVTLAFVEVTVPALPTGARTQDLLYRRSGATEFLIAAHLANQAAQLVQVDELSPGVTYEFATRAFSALGKPSSVSPTVSTTISAAGVAPAFNAGVVTPAQLTADVIDYNPSETANSWRLASDSTIRTIRSIAGGSFGRTITLYNVNGAAGPEIAIANQDALGTAAHRIITGLNADGFIPGDGSITLWYDGLSLRWRRKA